MDMKQEASASVHKHVDLHSLHSLHVKVVCLAAPVVDAERLGLYAPADLIAQVLLLHKPPG